jgi:putative hydrolase of the HAD superfamily
MVKFVYFDVGGTVIKDFSGTNNWDNLKKEIGIKDDQYERFDLLFDKHLEINTTREVDTLKPLIEKEFGVKFGKNYSLLINGFVNRFETNKSIWSVVKEIQKTSKVGLLTNMYPGMFEAIKKRKLIPDINWDEIIDSSIVALQKPDSDIYKLAQNKSGVNGGEILFVDNVQENIDTAQKFGWKTFLYNPKESVLSSKNLLEYFHLLNEK